MKLSLKAKLMNMYHSNDYTNKETGEVIKGKHKLQLLVVKEMKDGSKKQEIIDISIPLSKVPMYKGMENKEVNVDVAIIGNCNFYGV